MNNLELSKMANEVRKSIVTAVHSAKAGHPGGSLSAADLFTYLYFEELNIDPADPKNNDRDRFVLSKILKDTLIIISLISLLPNLNKNSNNLE